MVDTGGRVCVVGAGAAGLTAAWSLSRSGRFEVTVLEAADRVGGVATTLDVRAPDGAQVRINDQVQGGAPSYGNTRCLFGAFGFELPGTHLKVALGTGETAWNNTTATDFIRRMRPEIARFQRLLGAAASARVPAMLVNIETALRLGQFSAEFRYNVVYPLMSLFFASGTDSMSIPLAIVAQLFFDEEAKLFDFDADTFLSAAPPMVTFPNLGAVYEAVAGSLPNPVRTSAPVLRVARRADGVQVQAEGQAEERYDAVIFACSAEKALHALTDSTALERFALGGVDYQEATLVTHTDADYLRRHYGCEPTGPVQYYSRNDTTDPTRLEMSFNLTRYQPPLQAAGLEIYQTIDPFDALDPDRVLCTRVSRHNKNGMKHFLRVLPSLRFVQGRRRTWYVGSWTLFNIHEFAIASGLAAAEALGAPYPFAEDRAARRQYDLYRQILYGVNPGQAARRACAGSPGDNPRDR